MMPSEIVVDLRKASFHTKTPSIYSLKRYEAADVGCVGLKQRIYAIVVSCGVLCPANI